MKKYLILIILICLAFAGTWFSMPVDAITAYAFDSPYSVDGKQISSYNNFTEMYIVPENDGSNGSGMVAMSILLQFYNDLDTHCHGMYIPDDNLYYNAEPSEDDLAKTARANALRDDLNIRTPKDQEGIFINATSHSGHKLGINSYLNANCSDLNITAYSDSSTDILEKLDNDIPVILTVAYYNYYSYNGMLIGSEEARVMVAYGYKYDYGKIRYLCHMGRQGESACWVGASSNTSQQFEYGYCYINAPLYKYNTTEILDGAALRIDSVNRNLTGEIAIPSNIDGIPITEIGDSAFKDQDLITKISIPSTVTSIGVNAFANCYMLETADIAYGVQIIGEYAFHNCSMLSNITIPQSVTSIGSLAFGFCENLKQLVIPTSVTNIGTYAFNASGLTSFVIPSSVFIINDGLFSSCCSLSSVTIPVSITSIGEKAFDYCESLTSVTIPSSVNSIGYNAFYSCSNLVNITLNLGLNEIGYGAFSYCSSISNIAIPNSVTSIGNYAFLGCKKLLSAIIPNSVTNIGNGAFSSCDKITNVQISLNISNLPESVFISCIGLTSVVIPANIESIGEKAFYNCTALTSVTISNGVTNIGEKAFYNCIGITSITLPNSIISIGEQAFYDCYKITSLTIPDSVTSIGFGAFSLSPYRVGCLTSIVIPFVGNCLNGSSNTHFGYIFGACFNNAQVSSVPSSLKSVTITGGNTIDECAFWGLIYLWEIVMPESLTEIGIAAFYCCGNLKNVIIPDTVTNVGSNAFLGCSNLGYEVFGNIKYINNIAIAAISKGITVANLKDATTEISSYAFDHCLSLESVTFNTLLTTIGEYAFYSCTSLTCLVIQNSVIIIGESAFYQCENLTIYSESISAAVDWQTNWNISSRPVIWNCIVSADKTYIVSLGSDLESSIFNPNGYVISTPTRTNFFFAGWYTETEGSGIKYDNLLEIASDTAVYAYWSDHMEVGATQTVTFNSNGGSETNAIIVEEGGTISLPSNPSKVGSVFDGWYLDNGTFITLASDKLTLAITEDITVYAKWVLNAYEVIFNVDMNYGETFTMPAIPEKTGYTFGGWYLDNDTFLESATTILTQDITSDVIVYAKWIINEYTICFDSNDGSEIAPIISQYGTFITMPSNPIKVGYTFSGWYLDNDTFSQLATDILSQSTLSDVTVYAKWTLNIYVIVFISNGGSLVENITTDHGEIIEIPSAPEKVGHTFAGWYLDNDTFLESATTLLTQAITSDVILYAKWIINEYKISFNSNNGTVIAPIISHYGTFITMPSDPIKEGYTFSGWYLDNVTFEQTAMTILSQVITSNVNTYAKWVINEYTVDFNSNEGSTIVPITSQYGTVVMMPSDPTKEGSVFGGWYLDNETFLESAINTLTLALTANIVVYAKWVLNVYEVTFNIGVNHGETINMPPVPTKVGYTFAGWYLDNGTYLESATELLSQGITSNVNIYAKWVLNEYTVTFNSNTGSAIAPIITQYGKIITVPCNPVKEGSIFGGWYLDNGIFIESATQALTHCINSDIIVYAKWTLCEYLVIFEGNGGTLISGTESQTVSYGNAAIAPIYENGMLALSWNVAFNNIQESITVTAIWNYAEDLESLWNENGSLFYDIWGNVMGLDGNEVEVDTSYKGMGIKTLKLWGDVMAIECQNEDEIDTIIAILTEDFKEYNLFYSRMQQTNIIVCTTYSIENILNGDVAHLNNAYYDQEFKYLIKYYGEEESFVIPSSVTAIGFIAFACSGLTSIVLPNGLTSIGIGAFSTCENLLSIIIPSSVINIGFYSFQNCNNLIIYAETSNMPNGWSEYWNPENRPVLWNNIEQLVTYSFITNGGSNIEDITASCILEFPFTVKEGFTLKGWYDNEECLGNACSAPYNSSVVTILYAKWITEEIYTTGLYFEHNDSGYTVYNGTASDANIIIPNYYNGEPVTIIGYRAFFDSDLSSITIPCTVKIIKEYAFCYCIELTSIIIPNGVTKIDSCVFFDCNSLISVIIPDSVKSIGDRAFYNCNSLVSISLPEGLQSIGLSAFWKCFDLKNINIPYGVTVIGDAAFAECTSLITITIPSSIISIGEKTFARCDNLVTINLPSSVISIGKNAFNACTSITYFSIPSELISIGDSAFAGCSGLITVNIPNGVNSIGFEAFKDCTSLINITLPNSLENIGDGAFRSCANLQSIQVGINNSYYSSLNGVLFSKDGSILIHYPAQKIVTSYTIPDDVTSIEAYAFYGCKNLLSIITHDGIISIGAHAFESCENLETINIPNYILGIEEYTFFYCKSLTSVILPQMVTYINTFAFFYCINLTTVIIPSGVTSIGPSVFENCFVLTNIILPEGLESIGDYTFDSCHRIFSMSIPNSVTFIGDKAFTGCFGLTSIAISNSVTSIGNNAFFYCVNLTTITLSNSVTDIGYNAFKECNNLISITIEGETPPSIGYSIFEGTTSNFKIYVPSASVDAYKEAWQQYADKIEAIM